MSPAFWSILRGGADEDDWFVETAPPPGLAMDDAAWERHLRDTPPATPKAPAPQPAPAKSAAPQPAEDDRDEAAFPDLPEYRRAEGDPFREEIEKATKDWEKKGWGKVITTAGLEAGKLIKVVRLNYKRCRVASQPEARTFEGRPQIRCLMEYEEYGKTWPVMDDPRRQFALWPSQTVIRIDQLENGMELIYGVKPEREDTLYRIDAVDRAADGSAAVSMTNLADGSAAKQSFRPNDRFLELAQEEQKLEYMYYDDEKGQHVLMDPKTYDMYDLFPAELGKALSFIEAAETVHDVTRCMLDGKQTDLWAEVTLKVLSTVAMPAGGTDQLAAAKNGLQFWVPGSVVPGDLIRVDTRTGAFLRKTAPEELPHGRDVQDSEFQAAPVGEGEEGYKIIEYTGKGKRQVVVPALVGGKPITEFSMDIFGGSEVESVIVSEGIRKISTGSVDMPSQSASDESETVRWMRDKYTCRYLTRISLPGSVTAIDRGAFPGCPQLREIDLPDGLTELGLGAFMGCARLTSIRIPGGVKTVRAHAFEGCTGLTSVVLSEGVEVIDSEAFAGCSALQDIALPRSLTRVEDFAFCRCGSLTTVTARNPRTDLDGFKTFEGCPRVQIKRM